MASNTFDINLVVFKNYIVNSQFGVADSKYVVSDDPHHPVT